MNRNIWTAILGLTLGLLLLAGCSKKENTNEEQGASSEAKPAATAAPIDPATAASVSGTVTFDGAAPKPVKIDMSQDPACKGANQSETLVADGGKLPKGVDVVESVADAVRGADAAVIVTEWDELKGLASPEVRESMANPLIVDGRNLLDPEQTRLAGFAYEGIGRPTSPTDVLPQTPEPERAQEV